MTACCLAHASSLSHWQSWVSPAWSLMLYLTLKMGMSSCDSGLSFFGVCPTVTVIRNPLQAFEGGSWPINSLLSDNSAGHLFSKVGEQPFKDVVYLSTDAAVMVVSQSKSSKTYAQLIAGVWSSLAQGSLAGELGGTPSCANIALVVKATLKFAFCAASLTYSCCKYPGEGTHHMCHI